MHASSGSTYLEYLSWTGSHSHRHQVVIESQCLLFADSWGKIFRRFFAVSRRGENNIAVFHHTEKIKGGFRGDIHNLDSFLREKSRKHIGGGIFEGKPPILFLPGNCSKSNVDIVQYRKLNLRRYRTKAWNPSPAASSPATPPVLNSYSYISPRS